MNSYAFHDSRLAYSRPTLRHGLLSPVPASALQVAMSRITAARVCLTLNALVTAIGPFAAGWSETHVFNPKWTPHAIFHNGQTMSMGALLGLATLYYTWRPDPALGRESIKTAAIFSSLYYISGISAAFYPGASAIDPEFGEGHPQLLPLWR